jgi:hypothetical protein
LNLIPELITQFTDAPSPFRDSLSSISEFAALNHSPDVCEQKFEY